MSQEKKPGRSRIPITPERKEKIIALIERWTVEWGRLTGPTLETRVETCLGWKLSRIGMFKHPEIETAFEKRRLGLVEGKPPKKRRPAHEEVTAQRIKRLENDNTKLEKKVDNLLEMIARHHFNAQRRGMTIAELEAPLNQARTETQFPDTGKKKR
ncbi:hypothetical protein SAQ01S_32180 [Sphingomonas aquatilis NBRC 16722]|uniref:Transposase n=1 Tax=Sphingomonas aquatilis TaxID=93063 RepID=A0AAW3TXP1_9SPHN|nr:hypothetical protein [Sphingomonas aquatilis]MBB3877554.1 hypothetical protein [Sphingomonas aquatilis]GEM73452.1 hypothetical protein SAQ01S_32180 [Sphingomonas aquatilis NBRC 16722]